MSNQQKTVELSRDEFLKVSEVVSMFLERGTSENMPTLVIFMGGVGAGKTTIRRQQFDRGYVHFEFGEIYLAVKKAFGEDNPRLADLATLTSSILLSESMEKKKNIVTEIIGEDPDSLTSLIDKMEAAGYKISLKYIECDVAEAYQRHKKAVEEDPDYISAAHMQEVTFSIFNHQLGI